MTQPVGKYSPFDRGPFPVGVRTIQVTDKVRNRIFPCEIWYPAAAQYAGQDLMPGSQDTFTVPDSDNQRSQTAVRDALSVSGILPLIIFSHGAGRWHRYAGTFLCTHLSSHGYMVAALSHSEVVAAELAGKAGESDDQKATRVEAAIASRVPDIRFIIDQLFQSPAWESAPRPDPNRTGIVGHSFGGWTALSAIDVEHRIRAVVALAPDGSSHPKPGILPVKLAFKWGRDVPALYLVAENDTPTPLSGMYELFQRTPARKRMIILRGADHFHFTDNVEEEHERVRTMALTGDLAWIPKEMQPITQLCSGEKAHLAVRGLTLSHMDATLRQNEKAQSLLDGNIQSMMAKRGVEVIVPASGAGM